MKMTIEITNPDDMMIVKRMLDGYLLSPTDEPRFYRDDKHKPAEEPVNPASRGRTGNGATAAPADAKTEAAEPEAPEKEETQPEPAPEADNINPFADEVAKPKKAAKKLTREDVNAAFQEYMTTFGQSAAMIDVVKLLEKTFSVKKIKDIPSTQEAYQTAIQTVKGVIETNFFGRERL